MNRHTYYIDPAAGDDAHDGLSPERAIKNYVDPEIRPGDTVLFKRGSVIRGPLRTRDGAEGAPVTYGAYGDGEKPVFLGSVAAGRPELWVEARPTVWQYTGALASEICNLVFDDGAACGVLRWAPEALREPGDWHYTAMGLASGAESWGAREKCEGVLYLCAPENPARFWRDIECVLWGARKLAAGRRHIVFENLCFRNSGVHGFQDCDVRNVTIRDCDFRHIGGAVWHRDRRIRFGNAIELWDGAWDVTVERCRFDAIYDSGVTHQGGETRNIPERLHFRGNHFTDCGMAAYECREPSAEVYFERNRCRITGGGFGLQGEPPPRQSEIYPRPMGHHVFIWRVEPGTQPGRVYIRDNTFSEAPHGAAIYSIIDPRDECLFVLDRNVYEGTPDALLLRWNGHDYRTKEFERYRTETGQDAHSRVACPLVNETGGVTVPASIADDPLLAAAYRAAAEQNVLRALNPKVFFGYFSVCADGQGHGHNTTYPGLDWGQSAEALLWLGRKAEVLASWDYVKSFQREDGLLPFAILPDSAGTTSMVHGRYPLVVDARGAVFEHWVPGNPLRVLANVTFLLLADAIRVQTGDTAWSRAQAPYLRKAAEWLMTQITEDGLVHGGGFYVERPTRLEFDGINQCYTAHALEQAAGLLAEAGETAAARRCRAASEKIAAAFRRRFWAGDHCVEYIHPEHGPISRHGLTDVDWAAIATGAASDEQIAVLWPQLKDNPDFTYSGMPGGLATKPETYEDWEMQGIDRHDLAAMGRVWYLECWARARMGDRAGILRSLRQVAAVGKANNGSWMERYYSEKTGDLGQYHFQYYCEYPANFIRIVHRFLEEE